MKTKNCGSCAFWRQETNIGDDGDLGLCLDGGDATTRLFSCDAWLRRAEKLALSCGACANFKRFKDDANGKCKGLGSYSNNQIVNERTAACLMFDSIEAEPVVVKSGAVGKTEAMLGALVVEAEALFPERSRGSYVATALEILARGIRDLEESTGRNLELLNIDHGKKADPGPWEVRVRLRFLEP